MFILVNIWMIGKSLMKKKLPEEEELFSNLNLEDIPDAEHMHGERFCKDF